MADTNDSDKAQTPRQVNPYVDWVKDKLDWLWRNAWWTLPGIGLLYVFSLPENDPRRQTATRSLDWAHHRAEAIWNRIEDELGEFRRSLLQLAIFGLMVAPAAMLAGGLIWESRLTKAVWEFAWLALISYAFHTSYFRNFTRLFLAAVAGGTITTWKSLFTWLAASNEARYDFGGRTGEAALLDQVERALDQASKSFTGGIDRIVKWMVWAYQRPVRVIAWMGIGAVDLTLLNYHQHPFAYFVSLIALATLLHGILGWREGSERGLITRRMLRFAGWVLLVPVPVLIEIPEAMAAIRKLQYVTAWGKVDQHITVYLNLLAWLAIFPYSMVKLVFVGEPPAEGEKKAKTDWFGPLEGAFGLLAAFIIGSFFLNEYWAAADGSGKIVMLAAGVAVGAGLLNILRRDFGGAFKGAVVALIVAIVGIILLNWFNHHRPTTADVSTNQTSERRVAPSKSVDGPVITITQVLPASGRTCPVNVQGRAYRFKKGSVVTCKRSGQIDWDPLFTLSRALGIQRIGVVDDRGGKWPATRCLNPDNFPLPNGDVGIPYIRIGVRDARPVLSRPTSFEVLVDDYAQIGLNFPKNVEVQGFGGIPSYSWWKNRRMEGSFTLVIQVREPPPAPEQEVQGLAGSAAKRPPPFFFPKNVLD